MIHASCVGALSTRSARPPARVRSNSSCSRTSPPVRALISRARAATSVRVSPSARNLPYAGLRRSAPENSHQLCCSHCSMRRSSQLVSSVSRRSMNSACSCAGIPSSVAHSSRKRLTAEMSSSEPGACTTPTSSVAAAGLREQRTRGVDEVARHAIRTPDIRDPPHRVRQVAVKARKEPKAMLGRQIRSPARTRARNTERARLAAEQLTRLIHAHVKPALDKLVRGAQATDPTAQHGHRGSHRQTLHRCRRPRRTGTSCRADLTPPTRARTTRVGGAAHSPRAAQATAAARGRRVPVPGGRSSAFGPRGHEHRRVVGRSAARGAALLWMVNGRRARCVCLGGRPDSAGR